MTDSKHTPGPWWADCDMGHSPCEGAEGHGLPDWVVGCQSPAEVAYVARRYHNGRMPEIEAANARLIAAAPELLAAVELMLPLHEACGHAHTISIARAAIAKARGE